jgi:hypothetical protein
MYPNQMLSLSGIILDFADDWEVSHLGTAIGSVVVVASMRQLLASLWPAYAQSSNAANKQVTPSYLSYSVELELSESCTT